MFGSWLRLVFRGWNLAPNQMIVITVLVVGVLGASVGLASKQAPQKCGYARDNGLYWSTYGGPLQRAVVPAPDLGLLDNILRYDTIVGTDCTFPPRRHLRSTPLPRRHRPVTPGDPVAICYPCCR